PEAGDEPQVGIGVDVDLEVEELPQAGLDEDQDAFQEDDRQRQDPAGAVRPAVAYEVVDRYLHRMAGLERREMSDEEVVVDRARMVEVVLQQVRLAAPVDVAVVAVLLDEGDAVLARGLENRTHDGGLARTRPARDPEDARPGTRDRGQRIEIGRGVEHGMARSPARVERWRSHAGIL